ncbi:GGDEF and EAL domain-containing protein [Aquabacter sp. L1I39]|uniref:GGDEF and EAL domain-containing protein n=1 Tax=Aquabacter sp. L1I39 TaxID=2820278 RepID=UPI001AD96D4F|nr:GGDEF and EAL domain-containing protein [Aquabacter sp. L1I39]QTL01808.1 GGDEF and EAL domain-containing protein [Aquabacter sp. L1I39]
MVEDPLALLAAAGAAAYRWDIDTDDLAWTANVDAILGPGAAVRFATGSAFIAQSRLDPAHPGSLRAVLTRGDTDTGTGVPYASSFQLQAEPTRLVWVSHAGRWFAGHNGRPSYAVGTLHLLGPAEAPLHTAFAGHVDALTGLPTRTRLMEVLGERLAQKGRRKATGRIPGDAGWALFLVGIDHLGRVNDTFGFEVADEIIAQIADRLRLGASPKDLVARFSGNKFALLVNDVAASQLAQGAAALIAEIRRAPVLTSAGPIPVSVTVGAVTMPARRSSPTEVMARAQEAHGIAKRREHGSVEICAPHSPSETRRRRNVRLADEIMRALEENRIQLAVQPVADTLTRQPVFHEVLARVLPAPGLRGQGTGRIVKEAEKLGLMGVFDRKILRLVAAAMRRDPTLTLSVNVSPSSLADQAWHDLFTREVTPDIAGRLILEVTESVAVHDFEAARDFVAEAHRLGAQVAIDDFGAGFTSFRNLRGLGIDMVKIDGSFVMNMAKSPDDRTFVEAMIQLTRQLGITCVAEWVQNERTAHILASAGCHYIQGSLTGLARPLGPETAGSDAGA